MDTADAAREFDTLAVMRKLEAAGVGRKQAEAHTEALRDSRAGLATKRDLDAGLGNLDARIQTRIERAEKRAPIALITVAAAIIAAIEYMWARLPASRVRWRRGWDSNPRYAVRTTVFETAPFGRSGTPPRRGVECRGAARRAQGGYAPAVIA